MQAHLFVASLTLLLHRLLERKPKAGEKFFGELGFEVLKTITPVEFETEEETKKRLVRRDSEQRARY